MARSSIGRWRSIQAAARVCQARIHRVVGLGRDLFVLGQPRAVTDRELDHPGHQPRPFGRREAVAVQEQAQLHAATGGGLTRAVGLVQVVTEAELGVPPATGGQLLQPVGGAGHGPVDEPDRLAGAHDDMPGTDVAVADDGIAGVAAQAPRLPHRLWGWLEARGGVVQDAQQLADLEDPLLGVGVWVGDLALDVGQHLPSLVVIAVAHDPRRAGEADLLQVPQQRVHGGVQGPAGRRIVLPWRMVAVGWPLEPSRGS
jgi:hypothetical protein